MPTVDLWPDFKIDPKPRGIRQMLEEAGEGLKPKTKDLVEFRAWPADGRSPEFPFRFRCELYVRTLDYHYPLFEVYSSATGFPAQVRTGGSTTPVVTEAELFSALGEVFQAAETRAVIQNLISMATE